MPVPPPELRFKNSKERLKRAYSHHKALLSEWDALLKDESAGPVIRNDKDPGWYIVTAQLTPAILDRIATNTLSLEVGEMVYQLRSALDSLIWDAITYTQGAEPPANANRLEFPIRPVGEFKNCAFHKFPFPQNLASWLESVQVGAAMKPPNDPDFGMQATLEDIHDLARFDRHRRLRVTGVVPTSSTLEIAQTSPAGGGIEAHEWLDCDILNGKYDFVRLRVVCPGGLIPYKVRVKINLLFEITMEDIIFYDGKDLGVQLGRFIKAVERTIDRFDREFC